MHILKEITRVLKTSVLLSRNTSLFTSWQLSALRGAMNKSLSSKFDWKDGEIIYKANGKSFKKNDVVFFGNDLELLDFCIINFDAVSTEDGLIFSYGLPGNKHVKVRIVSFDTCTAFREIFIETPYYFKLQTSSVVLDVGMNIGLASLFFASMPEVKMVYGYEIAKASFKEALNNIHRNDTIKHKIEAHLTGIAAADGSVVIDDAESGSMGSNIYDGTNTISARQASTVPLKDIADVVKKLKKNHSECQLMIKLDCEGAEYEIIERLYNTSLLQFIDVFIIEWHVKGWRSIVDMLHKGGFICFASDLRLGFPVGYVHAVNRHKSISG